MNKTSAEKVELNEHPDVPPMVVEIGMGEAWLCRAFSFLCVPALPIDFNRSVPQALPAAKFDLHLRDDLDQLMQLLWGQPPWLLFVSLPLKKMESHENGLLDAYMLLVRASVGKVPHVIVEALCKSDVSTRRPTVVAMQ